MFVYPYLSFFGLSFHWFFGFDKNGKITNLLLGSLSLRLYKTSGLQLGYLIIIINCKFMLIKNNKSLWRHIQLHLLFTILFYFYFWPLKDIACDISQYKMELYDHFIFITATIMPARNFFYGQKVYVGR